VNRNMNVKGQEFFMSNGQEFFMSKALRNENRPSNQYDFFLISKIDNPSSAMHPIYTYVHKRYKLSVRVQQLGYKYSSY
jgi:hypothetical protein